MIDSKKILNFYIWILISYVIMEVVLTIRYSYETDVGVFYLKDFANYWIAAKVMFEGDIQTIFTQSEFILHHKAAFGEAYPWRAWSYPPSFLLFLAPLYLFEYHVAYLVFTIATLAMFYYGAVLCAKEARFKWLEDANPWKNKIFVLLLLAIIIVNIRYFQNGFLTSGILLFGLGFWYKKPILAGFFIGLLTIKPQLGILIPFLLLLDRNWLAIISATLTAFALIVISSVIFGIEAWVNYIEITIPYQSLVLTHFGEGTDYMPMMLSGFMLARSFGFDAFQSWIVHSIFVVPAVFLLIKIFMKVNNQTTRFTTLVIGTFLISPYNFNYDAGVLSVYCAFYALITKEKLSPQTDELKSNYLKFKFALFCFAATLPVTAHLLGIFLIPPTPFLLILCLFFILPESERVFKNLEARLHKRQIASA